MREMNGGRKEMRKVGRKGRKERFTSSIISCSSSSVMFSPNSIEVQNKEEKGGSVRECVCQHSVSVSDSLPILVTHEKKERVYMCMCIMCVMFCPNSTDTRGEGEKKETMYTSVGKRGYG